MTTRKKRDIMFYVFVGFLSLILSIWLILVNSINTEEKMILQQQIDSLIFITSTIHYDTPITFDNDTVPINFQEYLPKNRITESNTVNVRIIQHAIIFSLISVFIFLYIRCSRFIREDEPGCWFFKKKKKEK